MAAVSIRQTNILADQTVRMYQHPLTVNNIVLKVNIGISAIQRRMNDIAVTQSRADLEKFAAEIEDIEKNLYPYFDLLSERFLGDLSTITDARKAFSDWKDSRTTVIELARAQKHSQMDSLVKAKSDESAQSLSTQMNDIGDFSRNNAADFLLESEAIHDQSVLEIVLYMAVLLIAAGAIAFYVVKTVMLTERNLKNIIVDMDRQERLFKSMFHATSDGIVLTDTDRKIIMANKGMRTTFGYEEHELLGHKTSILYESIEEFERQGRIRFNMSAEEKAKPYVVRYRHKDGHVFPGETIGTIIKDENGEVLSFLGVMRDISERVTMEETLRHAQKMESLGNLAGGIAHDVNNMLLPIISLSEMTLKDVPEESQAHKRLEKVIQAGIAAKQLIASILTFSHRSDLKVKKEKVNIVSVIEDALKCLRPLVPSNISMTDNLDPNTGHVFCDKFQIGNILNYLTTNSIDSIEDRVGSIHVSVSQTTLTPPLADKIGKLAPGKYAHISFSDTGCGIDADNMVKIFDPFFTTKDVGKGTGLGLSMAYGIIERHGGVINVSSQVDAGTTFEIYLPLMDQSGS
ncbi:hypothetical protein BEN30_08600 [Magnetovibrio blakemorei]|uniref:histidine kinase n=2 Tax=Magnetovibrio blakemorei TaxID=28181 RepID=A0A1E5Q8R7_9PROT|nr:hypothetical protein BEN30_08600 [Magnetovibrio blakemorei]